MSARADSDTLLVTFSMDTPNPIRITRTFAQNKACVVGTRHSADLTFQCDKADFVYNFITGKLTSHAS